MVFAVVVQNDWVASFVSLASFVGMGYSKPSNLPPDISWSSFCSRAERRASVLFVGEGVDCTTSLLSLEKGEIRYTIMAG